MSSFISRIKEQVGDQKRRYGRIEQCSVNLKDLEDLIYHFERLDYEARKAYDGDRLAKQDK